MWYKFDEIFPKAKTFFEMMKEKNKAPVIIYIMDFIDEDAEVLSTEISFPALLCADILWYFFIIDIYVSSKDIVQYTPVIYM